MQDKVHQFTKNEIETIKRNLKEKVIGQDEACSEIISMLENQRIRIDDNSILGYFLFSWPSWCGKNLIVSTIAESLWWKLEILDASQYYSQEFTSLLWVSQWYAASDRKSILQEIYEHVLENNSDIYSSPKFILLIDELDKLKHNHDDKQPLMTALWAIMNILERAKHRTKSWDVELNLSNMILFMSSNLYLDKYVSKKDKWNSKKRRIWFATSDWEIDEEKEISKKRMILDNLKKDLWISVYSRLKNNVIVFNDIWDQIFEEIFKKEYNILIEWIKEKVPFNFNNYPDYTKYYEEYKNEIDPEIGWARQIKQIINKEVKASIIKEYLQNQLDENTSNLLKIIIIKHNEYMKYYREYSDESSNPESIPF